MTSECRFIAIAAIAAGFLCAPRAYAQGYIKGTINPVPMDQLPALGQPAVEPALAASGSFAGIAQARAGVGVSGPDTGCSTPRQLGYGNGTLIQRTKLVAYYWSTFSIQGTMSNFYGSILNSPYIDWLKEYDTEKNHIQRGGIIAQFVDSTPPTGNPVLASAIVTRLNTLIAAHSIPAPDKDTVYAIHPGPGVNVRWDFSNPQVDSCSFWCGIHSQISGLNIMIVADMTNSSCATGCKGNSDGALLSMNTMAASHELTESITDPDGLGWTDNNSIDVNANLTEIGDFCNQQTTQLDGWTVQELWSAHSQLGISIQPSLILGQEAYTVSGDPDGIIFQDQGAAHSGWSDTITMVNGSTSGANVYNQDQYWGGYGPYSLGYPVFHGKFAPALLSSVMVYNHSSRTWNVAEDANGTGLTWEPPFSTTNNFGDNMMDDLFVGDFNNDGLTDVGFYHWWDGNVWVGLNHWVPGGNSYFSWYLAANISPSLWNGTQAFSNDKIIVADFDGNGSSDIGILNEHDGSLWVGLASVNGEHFTDGTGTIGVFQWMTPSVSAQIGTPEQVADARMLVGHFAGSSRNDIMFYLNSTQQWWVAKNTYGAFAPVLFATTGGFGPYLQRDWFTVVSKLNGTAYDGVMFNHITDGNWWGLSSNGSSFSVYQIIYNGSPFGNLTGDMYAPYSDWGPNANSGISFYDNKNEYFGNVFLNNNGVWLWWTGNGFAGGNLGHLYGW